MNASSPTPSSSTSRAIRRILSRHTRRPGKILVVFVIVLPALVGVVGLVVDSGLLTLEQRRLQHVADAAAGAAARDLQQGKRRPEIRATVNRYVRQHNDLPDADVRLLVPPQKGSYARQEHFVEVELTRRVKTYVLHLLGGDHRYTVRGRSVAGFEPSTADAAIVVLEPRPSNRAAGLDVIAFRDVQVTGAILVNTEWGALDEEAEPAGQAAGPYFAIRCRGGRIRAPDVRVAGGVDHPRYYQDANLRANCLPVEDPFSDLEEPSTRRGRRGAARELGGVQISSSSSWGRSREPDRLQPGIYDWIEMTSGEAVFEPGLYVIRSVHPQTGMALRLASGRVSARGVLFYVTESNPSGPSRGSATGGPRSPNSVYINAGSDSVFSPLHDQRSPYDGFLVFQQRGDRRTVIIDQWQSTSQNTLAGCVYARDGHVMLRFVGTCQASFVCSTMRVLAWRGGTIAPQKLLPPAEDVFLVE